MRHPELFDAMRVAFDEYRLALWDDIEGSLGSEEALGAISELSEVVSRLLERIDRDIKEAQLFRVECRNCGQVFHTNETGMEFCSVFCQDEWEDDRTVPCFVCGEKHEGNCEWDECLKCGLVHSQSVACTEAAADAYGI